MTTKDGVEIQMGQTWREVDPRFQRIVEVTGMDSEGFNFSGAVQIRTVGSTRKPSWCRLDRFNGKRGGYELFRSVVSNDF